MCSYREQAGYAVAINLNGVARRSVGKVLAEAREAVGLTQTALARASNHTPGFISKIESEATTVESIRFATLASLAVPLGLSLDEIAFLTGLTTVRPGSTGQNHGPAMALISQELRSLRGALEGALRKLDAAEAQIQALSREPSRKDKPRASQGRPRK
jgi:transcriptional regulator with XRE-family HTH domain